MDTITVRRTSRPIVVPGPVISDSRLSLADIGAFVKIQSAIQSVSNFRSDRVAELGVCQDQYSRLVELGYFYEESEH